MLLQEYRNYIQPTYKNRRIDWPTNKRIVFELLYDLTNRRGFRQQWDDIDNLVQDDILRVWTSIVDEQMDSLLDYCMSGEQ